MRETPKTLSQNIMTNSTHLYSDEGLNTPLSETQVKSGKLMYFYDGNNGDKHLFVGYTEKATGVEYAMGVNLSQCHFAPKFSYKNANQVASEMFVPKNGKELQALFNKVTCYEW